MYEFSQVCDCHELTSKMEKNWFETCSIVLGIETIDIKVAEEERAISIIEKNVYQKKSIQTPVTFQKVCCKNSAYSV